MAKSKPKLNYYKLDPSVPDPVFATDGSACFDMHAWLPNGSMFKVNQDTLNKTIERMVKANCLEIYCMERVLVPTGIIFDIPEGYSVRLHSRSGLAWKDGLYLTNCEGIIDSDYVDPVFAMMTNISGTTQYVKQNERICQGELFKDVKCILDEIDEKPDRKTDRDGGFGSTGKE